MAAVFDADSDAAGIVTTSSPPLTTVVDSGVPLNSTVAPGTKCAPLTTSRLSAEPSVSEAGASC